MVERTVQIVNRNGLHARPAAEIVKTSSGFTSEITLVKDGMEVNAKSIMGVMMLAAGRGTKVVLETDGPDETEAMDALVALIGDYFGEGQ